MAIFLNPKITQLWCRCSRFLLAMCWVSGLIFRTAISFCAGDFVLPLLHSADFYCVSIVGLLSALLLPLLFSAIAVYLSAVWMLPFLAFVKGFSYSFLMYAFCAVAGAGIHAGWLLMLCDSCVMPMLLRYWFQHVSGEHKFQFAALLPTILTALCAGSIRFFAGPSLLTGFIR